MSPILLYNAEIWGGGVFLKRTKLTSFETFSTNLFDDTSKHEILQVKMAKIASTVHKKSCTLAVREELGLFPLNISIYTRMISYLCRVLDMPQNGNDLIQASLKECIELVNNKQKCWLTSVIFLLRLSGDDTNFMQLDHRFHLI